ncbi:GNAT family N-acetyltransferase [Veronia pacifica]|uniref:N-acetyltransferase domain-containing protein n=1 Tax=Veronia pacifica TaxID=1080227 RepID=A0A1C3EBP0_9GAMM|nr:GNAT family N-acetyltransferase [Veronia pacifica]ODA30604.1 hypothetical protein A8L45_19930 [Veronia pacifica]
MLKIQKLDHRSLSVAKDMLSLSLASYRVEADIIGVTFFPPLAEKVEDIVGSKSTFFGAFLMHKLVGIVEIEPMEEEDETVININRLVVEPTQFGKSVGTSLVSFVCKDNITTSVTTALKNIPAIRLYQKCGFEKASTQLLNEDITLLTMRRVLSGNT